MHFPIKAQGILLSSGCRVKRVKSGIYISVRHQKFLPPEGGQALSRIPKEWSEPKGCQSSRSVWITLSRMHRVGFLGYPVRGHELHLMIQLVGPFQLRRFYDIGYRVLLAISSGTGRQHARQGCRRKNICWLGQLKLDLKIFILPGTSPCPMINDS